MVLPRSSVYCEPFCIQDGYDFEIHHVHYKDGEDYSCFLHFHEVHELIFFEKIDGDFYYHEGKSTLKNYDVVFTPAMETHDFELSQRGKSWFIVQFPHKIFESQQLASEALFFQAGMHLRLDKKYSVQLQKIIQWLHESFHENPHSNKSLSLLKLAFIMLTEHAVRLNPSDQKSLSASSGFEKIQPIVELFRHELAVSVGLEAAAARCHLSPSYFSRVFKSVFRYSYSEYALRHKLYSAARLLSQSTLSVTDISYELHFSSPSHFISLFKKQFGRTPKKYRTDVMARMAP